MKYSIKTPIMASDIPDFTDLVFGGKPNEIVKQVIEKFTLDEAGNKVSLDQITAAEYMELVPAAMKALGFSGEGND